MPLRLATPPAEEPVSLAEAKAHLRVDLDDDDALIGALVAAARRVCEAELRRTLVTSAWELTLDGFPIYPIGTPWLYGSLALATLERPFANTRLEVQLPRPPLQSVESIAYVDVAGGAQTLDPSAYQVELGGVGPGRVVPAYGRVWPSTRTQPEAVTIAFTAGYGAAADVPDAVKAAIKLLVGHLYENREAVAVGTIATELPLAVKALLATEDWGSYA